MMVEEGEGRAVTRCEMCFLRIVDDFVKDDSFKTVDIGEKYALRGDRSLGRKIDKKVIAATIRGAFMRGEIILVEGRNWGHDINVVQEEDGKHIVEVAVEDLLPCETKEDRRLVINVYRVLRDIEIVEGRDAA